MKTLEEHNKEVFRLNSRRELTGISCPECETELHWVDESKYLSNPMQKDYECPSCKTTGIAYVNW